MGSSSLKKSATALLILMLTFSASNLLIRRHYYKNSPYISQFAVLPILAEVIDQHRGGPLENDQLALDDTKVQSICEAAEKDERLLPLCLVWKKRYTKTDEVIADLGQGMKRLKRRIDVDMRLAQTRKRTKSHEDIEEAQSAKWPISYTRAPHARALSGATRRVIE